VKYAFIDFDGTLVRLKTDHVACKKELGVKYYSEVPKEKYYIIDQYEWEAFPSVELVIESGKLLDKLNEHGYKIVIVSRTGYRVIAEAFKKFGLPSPTSVISRDDTYYLKPNPKHITDFINDFDKESVVIGDSWHDQKLAEALGLKYHKSVSDAMKGLGFRKVIHNDEVYNEELKFLKEYGEYPILDMGCGNRRGGDVCVDLVEGEADYIADICDLPFSDKTFQSTFMIHSLEHVEDYEKALREAWRVLKDGGVLGIVIPLYSMSFFDPTHKHHFEFEELNRSLQDIGFNFIANRTFNSIFDCATIIFSVGLIYRKG
jgi:HAD superfamily hydrolase (TIGR01549 family)